MKITVEHYDEKVSIEVKNDDITFDEFMEMQKRIALAIYNAETVEDYWK
jgi:hypothetical protein